MWTGELLAHLCADEEAPWADWHGHRLTARELADMLRGYEVTPAQIKRNTKNGEVNRRGYRRATFKDAWDRYLAPPAATAATAATGLASTVADVAAVADTPPATSKEEAQ
jgi:hypothetical protein